MSHRTTAVSNLTDLTYLSKALTAMGVKHQVSEEGTLSRGRNRYGVDLENQHILIQGAHIGIRIDAEKGAVISGDFYGSKFRENSLKRDIQHNYMEQFLKDKLKREGWKMKTVSLEGNESTFELTRVGF